MGLVNEVQHLLRMGYDISTPALDAIGYREIIEHLAGRFTLSEAISRAEKRTRDYAKRQMTWFRRQPGIQWVNAEEPVLATAQVRALYDRFLAETG
jgi:tRNA dimethylallyltransferase